MLPSGILVCSPYNMIKGNIVSGSDYDGISYVMPFLSWQFGYDRSVCPEGLELLLSQDNMVHSCKRYGFRLQNYAPRVNPCALARNDSLADPFSANKPIQAVFSNFTISSTSVGVFVQDIGQVDFAGFTVGDSKSTAFWFDKVHRRKTPVTVSSSAVIVTNLNTSAQLVVPPTNGLI